MVANEDEERHSDARYDLHIKDPKEPKLVIMSQVVVVASSSAQCYTAQTVVTDTKMLMKSILNLLFSR